jgi:hypothetical protein
MQQAELAKVRKAPALIGAGTADFRANAAAMAARMARMRNELFRNTGDGEGSAAKLLRRQKHQSFRGLKHLVSSRTRAGCSGPDPHASKCLYGVAPKLVALHKIAI